jgi:hypothetical protein
MTGTKLGKSRATDYRDALSGKSSEAVATFLEEDFQLV